MKTPEEMAEEYANKYDGAVAKIVSLTSFLYGYKAAQDQLADADKVMPDSWDHILDATKMVDVNYSNNLNSWISVKDRLPEDEGITVLVLISGNRWHDHDVAYFGPIKQPRSHILLYKNSEKIWRDKYDDIVEGVTHWQPLPELPKEEK